MFSFAPTGEISVTMHGAGETCPGAMIFAAMRADRRGVSCRLSFEDLFFIPGPDIHKSATPSLSESHRNCFN